MEKMIDISLTQEQIEYLICHIQCKISDKQLGNIVYELVKNTDVDFSDILDTPLATEVFLNYQKNECPIF